MRQNGFLLVVVEMMTAFFFLLAYILLVTDYFAWFSLFLIGIAWNFAMLQIDLAIYAMYFWSNITDHQCHDSGRN